MGGGKSTALDDSWILESPAVPSRTRSTLPASSALVVGEQLAMEGIRDPSLEASEGLEGLLALGARAVYMYSLFGSKDGLIAALGERTYQLLSTAVEALPTTQDAGADLVEAGVSGFRCLVVNHPGLFQLGIQQTHTCQGPATAEQVVGIRAAAARAWRVLQARVVRLERQGRLGAQSVDEAAAAFHALCEGMAALEIRGVLTAESAERQWRTALTDLVERLNISN